MDRYGEAQGWIGAGVRRKEDARLLTGAGSYVDDWAAPDALHLAVLRSPHAHARIRKIDVSKALALPGVEAVHEHHGAAQAFVKHHQCGWMPVSLAILPKITVQSA